jgi:uncharacterized membrane protein (UPF0127 family)
MGHCNETLNFAKIMLSVPAALLSALWGAPAMAVGDCAPDSLSVRGAWGQARFNVEIADDPDERALGLMNRDAMSASAGMLFVYQKPQHAVFWMKNTLIPLDILFADATGLVTSIHENAIPLDTTGIDGGANVTAVLEINGGLVSAMGISVGSVLQHPDFDQEIALWGCNDP